MQDNFSEKKSIADERNDLLEFLAVMNKRNNDIVMRLKSECLELRVIGKTQEKTHQLVVDYAQDYQSFNDNAEQRLCDVYYKYFNKENGNG